MHQINPQVKEQMVSMQFRIWLPHVTTRLCLQPGRLWAPHLRGRWPPYESCWIAEHSSWALVIPPASSHQGFSDLTPQATNHFYATSLSLNWAQNPFKTFFWKNKHERALLHSTDGLMLILFESHTNSWSREKGSMSVTLLHRRNVRSWVTNTGDHISGL